jgi:hypothetical protein
MALALSLQSLLLLSLLLSTRPLPLSNPWTSAQLHSPVALQISRSLSNCSATVVFHQFKNWGFGSEVHQWSQALCNAMEQGAVLQQLDQSWVWNDKAFCAGRHLQPLHCYFNLTNLCRYVDAPQTIIDYKNDWHKCPTWIRDEESRQVFRAASMEFLFSRLSSDIVKAAEDAAQEIFKEAGIPKDMMTVHIRWGDKSSEMRLVDISTYVSALKKYVDSEKIAHPSVFVVTESSEARKKLREELEKQKLHWTLFEYSPPEAEHPVHDRIPVRAAFVSEGATGKASMISLLLAMEARYFVLTTGSNWSRLINELRTNIVDRRCGNCTKMTDLQHAHRFHNWR